MLAAVRSDVGKVREINEDFTCLSKPYPNGLLLAIVADGMGGHLAGEVASKTAVDSVCDSLETLLNEELVSIDDYQQALEKAIHDANAKVYNLSNENDNYQGMGTTIVASIVGPDWIVFGHIGDSRAYIILEEGIRQLTSDHSLVNELLKNGQISEEEANSHPQKNILTRALGTDEEVEIDVFHVTWKQGDTLILCSDGLTNHLMDDEILGILTKDQSIEDATDQLLSQANDAGGSDNISIIVVRHD